MRDVRKGRTPGKAALLLRRSGSAPHEYLPPAWWQEPFKLSKLLKSVFLEGREVLIAILLAICFTWHEPSSLEDRGVLWNLGSAWGCGVSRCWVGFGGDRCDAGQRRVILAFPCIRSCRGGCL